MDVKTTVRIVMNAPETRSAFEIAAAIATALKDAAEVPRPYYLEVTKGQTTAILNGAWLMKGEK